MLVIAFALALFSGPTLASSPQAPQDNRQLTRDKDQNNPGMPRIALVIGNGAYRNAPALKNPSNDATLVAETLRRLKFEVTLATDRSQREMRHLIREFGQRLRAARAVGLFYFAGHGVQAKGRNYLIPVDADVKSEAELIDRSVDVEYVLSMMEEAHNPLNIVILDACRTNPFAQGFRSGQSGLAEVSAPSGTLIAYATAPGKTAADGHKANSPYTEELVKQIEVPDVLLETTFRHVAEQVSARTSAKQDPWVSSNVKGEFYFTGGAANAENLSTVYLTKMVNPVPSHCMWCPGGDFHVQKSTAGCRLPVRNPISLTA